MNEWIIEVVAERLSHTLRLFSLPSCGTTPLWCGCKSGLGCKSTIFLQKRTRLHSQILLGI